MHVNVNMDCPVYSLTFCSRAKSCTADEANKLRYIFVQREFALTQKNDEINSLCREMRVSRTQPKQKWVTPSRAASFRRLCDRYRHCALCRRWNRYHVKCAYSRCAPRPQPTFDDFNRIPIVVLDDIYIYVYLRIYLATLLPLCFNITTNSDNDYTNLCIYSDRQMKVHKIRNRRRHYNFT